MKKAFIGEKKTDPNFINNIVGKALEKANVKIVDNTFSDILAQYATTDQSKADKKSDK